MLSVVFSCSYANIFGNLVLYPIPNENPLYLRTIKLNEVPLPDGVISDAVPYMIIQQQSKEVYSSAKQRGGCVAISFVSVVAQQFFRVSTCSCVNHMRRSTFTKDGYITYDIDQLLFGDFVIHW